MPPAYNQRKENPRYEIIGGEAKMLAQPAIPHASVAKNLTLILGNYLRGKRCKLFSEIDVFFDEENRLVPDLLIVCDRSKIKYNGIHGAPDLVIEIISPSTAKDDKIRKKEIYGTFGVKEYWLVNPKDRSLEIYYNDQGSFLLNNIYHDYSEDEWSLLTDKEKEKQHFKIKVSLYDDLEVDVKEIFEDID